MRTTQRAGEGGKQRWPDARGVTGSEIQRDRCTTVCVWGARAYDFGNGLEELQWHFVCARAHGRLQEAGLHRQIQVTLQGSDFATDSSIHAVVARRGSCLVFCGILCSPHTSQRVFLLPFGRRERSDRFRRSPKLRSAASFLIYLHGFSFSLECR